MDHGDAAVQAFFQGQDKVKEIHRVQFNLIAKGPAGVETGRVDFTGGFGDEFWRVIAFLAPSWAG